MLFYFAYLGGRKLCSFIDDFYVNYDLPDIMEQACDIDAFHIPPLPTELSSDSDGITCYSIGMVSGVLVLSVDRCRKCLYHVMVNAPHAIIELLVLCGFLGVLQK